MIPVFVFGSNLSGIHGAGSAHHAHHVLGAEWGVGVGPCGNGNCYAIPTKDEEIMTLPLDRIAPYVRDFIEYAKTKPGHSFRVVRIGCGLAGYTDAEMSPLFAGAPDNVILPEGWR